MVGNKYEIKLLEKEKGEGKEEGGGKRKGKKNGQVKGKGEERGRKVNGEGKLVGLLPTGHLPMIGTLLMPVNCQKAFIRLYFSCLVFQGKWSFLAI